MNYEKQNKPKRKLKKWQIWSIVGATILFVVATIIFIVMWHNAIFSENVLAICLIILCLIFMVSGLFIFKLIGNIK